MIRQIRNNSTVVNHHQERTVRWGGRRKRSRAFMDEVRIGHRRRGDRLAPGRA